jgi:hypothetical protein
MPITARHRITMMEKSEVNSSISMSQFRVRNIVLQASVNTEAADRRNPARFPMDRPSRSYDLGGRSTLSVANFSATLLRSGDGAVAISRSVSRIRAGSCELRASGWKESPEAGNNPERHASCSSRFGIGDNIESQCWRINLAS